MPTLSEVYPMELSYLAGIIDGEGCIFCGINKSNLKKSLGRNRKVISEEAAMYLKIMVNSTDKKMLDRLKTAFGGDKVRPRKKRASHHKQSWGWQIFKQEDVKQCLLALEPYLSTKLPQAEAALMFLQTKGSTKYFGRGASLNDETKYLRRLCYNKIRQCNAGLWDNLGVSGIGHGVHYA